MLAVDRQSVHDDPAADAGSQSEQHQAVHVATAADPELAVGRGSGVVGKSDRQPAVFAHPIAEREIDPAGQVGRIEQHAGRNVHGAWRAQADAGNVARLQAGQLNGLEHGRGDSPGTVGRSGLSVGPHRVPGKGPAEVVDHADFDVGSAQVGPDEQRWTGVALRDEAAVVGHAKNLSHAALTHMVHTIPRCASIRGPPPGGNRGQVTPAGGKAPNKGQD